MRAWMAGLGLGLAVGLVSLGAGQSARSVRQETRANVATALVPIDDVTIPNTSVLTTILPANPNRLSFLCRLSTSVGGFRVGGPNIVPGVGGSGWVPSNNTPVYPPGSLYAIFSQVDLSQGPGNFNLRPASYALFGINNGASSRFAECVQEIGGL